ncbi:hypothetical protein PtA15_10A139 [Puccinia triticina]|uniref:Uncharacterized protein n=1 Tax=Puccinia triticina TaxID=208348 RepID=A0ABY7CUR2_9BASI|nr:uncharacterized protein PtA15_10A139 [Puccinia triticina]WAQ88720.1 hypothetical protein PtA15_10A139 [Puccinia triticina]WAR58789.1 hypothetical protein PtB15_10B128 [Puccinia triticina]
MPPTASPLTMGSQSRSHAVAAHILLSGGITGIVCMAPHNYCGWESGLSIEHPPIHHGRCRRLSTEIIMNGHHSDICHGQRYTEAWMWEGPIANAGWCRVAVDAANRVPQAINLKA